MAWHMTLRSRERGQALPFWKHVSGNVLNGAGSLGRKPVLGRRDFNVRDKSAVLQS